MKSKSDTLPIQDEEPELASPVHVDQWDRTDPAKVLLARLNPSIDQISVVLQENGISRVRADYIQGQVESRLKSKQRQAGKMAARMRESAEKQKRIDDTSHLPDNDPKKVHGTNVLVGGNRHGNRRQRKAMIKQGDKKRAVRESAFKQQLKREQKKAGTDGNTSED